jgi:hypothetical protein
MYCFAFSSPIFLTTIHNKGIYTYHLFHSTVQNIIIPTFIPDFLSTPLTKSVSLRQNTRNCFTVSTTITVLGMFHSLVDCRLSFFFGGRTSRSKNDEEILRNLHLDITPPLQKNNSCTEREPKIGTPDHSLA